MILRNHYINICIRVSGIILNCLAIAYVSFPNPDWYYIVNLIILLGIQIFLFIRSQTIINREIENLFASLENSETTINFLNKSKNPDFQKIFIRFNTLIRKIQRLKVDSYQNNVYFTTIFEHINIGIIILSNKGEIKIKNSHIAKILGKGDIHNISDIKKIDALLATAIEKIKPGASELINLYRDGFIQQLMVRAALLKLSGEEIKIISFQNISSEMDNREMESWQKLIRVMTHELMNSAGPINSTIATILELLCHDDQTSKELETLSQDILNDSVRGLKIIEDRSKGMIDFVDRFRSLTLIPSPKFERVDLDKMINNIIVLLSDDSKKSGVKINYKSTQANVRIIADKGMIEQIFINLIKNSFEALEQTSKPIISISAFSDMNNSVLIDISDNGKGIKPGIQEKIFIPFYSSRKKGTGVGLSLSRQLANIQGGTLTLNKSTRKETTFRLQFNRGY